MGYLRRLERCGSLWIAVILVLIIFSFALLLLVVVVVVGVAVFFFFFFHTYCSGRWFKVFSVWYYHYNPCVQQCKKTNTLTFFPCHADSQFISSCDMKQTKLKQLAKPRHSSPLQISLNCTQLNLYYKFMVVLIYRLIFWSWKQRKVLLWDPCCHSPASRNPPCWSGSSPSPWASPNGVGLAFHLNRDLQWAFPRKPTKPTNQT